MADEEHVDLLKQGVEVWNKWRQKTPDVKADLHDADLSGADLDRANLRRADLGGANLNGAKLNGADLAAGHGRPSCRVARRPGAAPGGTVEGARRAETGAAAMAAPSFGPVMHAL
jgi:hypothetical protein